MELDTPAKVIEAFVEFTRTRDLESLVALYEPDALFVPKLGIHLAGHDNLREAFAEFLAIEPVLSLTTVETLQTCDLALIANEWTLKGTTPDGTPIERSGKSAVVLRRRFDGSFRIVVDRLLGSRPSAASDEHCCAWAAAVDGLCDHVFLGPERIIAGRLTEGGTPRA